MASLYESAIRDMDRLMIGVRYRADRRAKSAMQNVAGNSSTTSVSSDNNNSNTVTQQETNAAVAPSTVIMGIKGLAKLLSDEAPDVRYSWRSPTYSAVRQFTRCATSGNWYCTIALSLSLSHTHTHTLFVSLSLSRYHFFATL